MVEEAIALEPTRAAFHSLLAAIKFDQGYFHAAIIAAERGLEQDPTHVGCAAIRARALLRVGSHAAAAEAASELLAMSPEHPDAHATRGSSMLKMRRPAEALEHLREALRLNPNNKTVVPQLIEALRIRNPIERALLRWFSHFGPSVALGILMMIAGIICSNERNPFVRVPGVVMFSSSMLLMVAAFTVRPLINLRMMVDPLGRLLLPPWEKYVAACVAGIFVFGVLTIVACLLWAGDGPARMFVSIPVIPATGIWVASQNRAQRRWWRIVTLVFAAAGIAWAALWGNLPDESDSVPLAIVYVIIALAIVAGRAELWRKTQSR
jgi:hypothetical protein